MSSVSKQQFRLNLKRHVGIAAACQKLSVTFDPKGPKKTQANSEVGLPKIDLLLSLAEGRLLCRSVSVLFVWQILYMYVIGMGIYDNVTSQVLLLSYERVINYLQIMYKYIILP